MVDESYEMKDTKPSAALSVDWTAFLVALALAAAVKLEFLRVVPW